MAFKQAPQVKTLIHVRQFLESAEGKLLLEKHGFRRALPFTARAHDERQINVPSIALYRKGIRNIAKEAVRLSIVDDGTRLIIKHDGKTLPAIRHLTKGIREGIGIENFEHERFAHK